MVVAKPLSGGDFVTCIHTQFRILGVHKWIDLFSQPHGIQIPCLTVCRSSDRNHAWCLRILCSRKEGGAI